jgi:hypothetical protein
MAWNCPDFMIVRSLYKKSAHRIHIFSPDLRQGEGRFMLGGVRGNLILFCSFGP